MSKHRAEEQDVLNNSSDKRRRVTVLLVLAIAQLLAMTLWFSASAVGPELADAWNLSSAQTAWLTNAVQLGFVIGAVLSAMFTLSDIIAPRYLVAGSAVLGAGATFVLAFAADSFWPAVILRLVTGHPSLVKPHTSVV